MMWRTGVVKGPCVMNKNVTFYTRLWCFHPVTSVNDCSMQSESACYKWIRGYFSSYYFCTLPWNKHSRQGEQRASGLLIWANVTSDYHIATTAECADLSTRAACDSGLDSQVHSDTFHASIRGEDVGTHWIACLASAQGHINT